VREMERRLKAGTIQPIKLGFDSKEIVYPFRITSINPGSTEVLSYVVTDQKVRVKNLNFTTEYAKQISQITTTYPKLFKLMRGVMKISI